MTHIQGDLGWEISGSLWWFGTTLPWSVRAAGVHGCAEEEDSPKGVTVVTKGGPKLQP